MIKIYPLNPRRLERLLTVLALQQESPSLSEEDITAHIDTLKHYDTQRVYASLPPEVQKRVIRNAQRMCEAIIKERDTFITSLTPAIKNRPFDAMFPIDQQLLLLGAYELKYNQSDPKIIVKEILICSDTMQNQKAGSYLSGILKTLAFGSFTPNFQDKYSGKRPQKISLKRDEHGQHS